VVRTYRIQRWKRKRDRHRRRKRLVEMGGRIVERGEEGLRVLVMVGEIVVEH